MSAAKSAAVISGRRPLRQVDDQWVADSPLGRVVVSFVGPNELGVADHAAHVDRLEGSVM